MTESEIINTEKCELCGTGIRYDRADGSSLVFKPHDLEFCQMATRHRIRMLEQINKSSTTDAAIANHRAILSSQHLSHCEDMLDHQASELKAKLAASEKRAEAWKKASELFFSLEMITASGDDDILGENDIKAKALKAFDWARKLEAGQ